MKKAKGFSLTEVIISIATLSIISGFILQMFIVSAKVNQKALDLDIGINIATTSIELFRQENTFSDYINLDFFKLSKINVRDGDVISINKFYDKDWNVVKPDDKKTKFILNTNIKQSEYNVYSTNYSENTKNENNVEIKILYNINSNIVDLEQVSSKKEMVNFNSSKYFKGN